MQNINKIEESIESLRNILTELEAITYEASFYGKRIGKFGAPQAFNAVGESSEEVDSLKVGATKAFQEVLTTIERETLIKTTRLIDSISKEEVGPYTERIKAARSRKEKDDAQEAYRNFLLEKELSLLG